MSNIILNTDSYKYSHWLQYPEGTEYISSYIEARSDKEYTDTLFFGLQMFLSQLKAPTVKQVMEANEIVTAHGLPFNLSGWLSIAKLGYLPIHIQAVKEGTVLPVRNALVQVTNTDARFPWLVGHLETALLRAVWYPTTVATRSKHIKTLINGWLEETCDDPAANLPFKLHDFGFRGVSSEESGSIGGLAHLVNFRGTDTVGALVYARKFYGESMAGYSIPAAEHSTITAWGKENEAKAYANMLSRFGGNGHILAVVSDSYDIYHACRKIWGETLADSVRNSGGTLVIRPDSGNPRHVPINVLKILDEKFGTTVNAKGFKVLPPYLRVIQGDGISEDSIATILDYCQAEGYSTENLAFGMGGELLQNLTRDTLGFAMKASAIKGRHEGWVDVYKDPATDPGKGSKRGRQAVVKRNGMVMTVPLSEKNGEANMLEDVFKDGKVLRMQTLAEIRAISDE